MAATQTPDGRNVVRPQPGPQMAFLATPADIAIYGGAAGGGKSWALLLEPLRHVARPDFAAVFFRRSTVQIRNPGGLWDESLKLYPATGAASVSHVLEWRFPSGARLKFAHLEHDKTVLEWQGAQVPLICFDELTHFTETQFWYMVSRNRSMTGIRPYIRATCNPDADSWVAALIEWWIDKDSGLPIPERAGVIRWFIRINDELIWGDSPADLDAIHPGIPPKSFTFVPAKLTDNAALMTADPTYVANLMALPRVERERLLGGNWKIRPAAGMYFQKSWFEVVDAIPAGGRAVRAWDTAATQETGSNDPDYTVGIKAWRVDGPGGLPTFYIEDVARARHSPAGVERMIKTIASQDGLDVPIRLPQDPAAAGKAVAHTYIKMLAGYTARAELVSGDKEVRAGPASAQAEVGNIKLLRAPWNAAFLDELEAFPIGKHDDQVDALSDVINELALGHDGSLGDLSGMGGGDFARANPWAL